MIDYIALPSARSTLEPRMRILTNTLTMSVNIYNARPIAWQLSLDAKSRALLLNRLWYYNVRQQLQNDAGVRLVRNHSEFYFAFDDTLVLRFKHLDRNLLSKNYRTQRIADWNRQVRLDGMPPWDRLEFGYRLDITGTSIQDAFVLLRHGERLLWVWQVMGPHINTFAIQMPLAPFPGGQSEVFAFDDYNA